MSKVRCFSRLLNCVSTPPARSCLIDFEPREVFSPEQQALLHALSSLVSLVSPIHRRWGHIWRPPRWKASSVTEGLCTGESIKGTSCTSHSLTPPPPGPPSSSPDPVPRFQTLIFHSFRPPHTKNPYALTVHPPTPPPFPPPLTLPLRSWRSTLRRWSCSGCRQRDSRRTRKGCCWPSVREARRWLPHGQL